MDYLIPEKQVDLTIPVLAGVMIGGTVLAALLFFITDNADLAQRKKKISNTHPKESDSNTDVDDSDLISFEDLKKLIPKRLYERLLWRSIMHMLVVLAVCVGLQWIYHNTIYGLGNVLEGASKGATLLALDIAFILLCGTCETGIWVVAHECGHHAFSKYEALNDVIGFILHSYLLAPYFSWQYSHGVHHSRNKHIDEDESHNPRKMRPGKKIIDKPERFMKRRTISPLFGWYAYLGFGLTGAKRNRAGKNIKAHSHFYKSDLFPPSYPSWKIWLSNLGMLITVVGIYQYAQAYGWWDSIRKFLGPRFVTNYWLVFITTTHHTHQKLKYMDGTKWTWYKGAIRTMDYDYGSTRSWLLRMAGYFFDFITLRITTTHVCHHLLSKMPHYHCREATPIIAKALGHHYKRPDSSATAAFYLHLYDWAYEKNSGDGYYSYAN